MLKTVRLRKINVWQASKIAAILYLVLFAIIFIPIGLFMSASGILDNANNEFAAVLGGAFFFIMPVFYAVFGFIFTAIFCALYNLVAGWTGGFEVQVTTFSEDEGHFSLESL